VRLLSFSLFFTALPLCAQSDPVLQFSRQVPKAEFLHVISDGRGDVFAVGRTKDSSFPVPRSASQPRWAGGYDVVIAKFRGSDGEMIAATFLGGNGDDVPVGIALDPQGFVYVAGNTQSTNFPTTEGAFQKTARSTPSNGFVSKFNNNLSGATFSTYLGGAGPTHISAVAADRLGNVYLTGNTDARDFPTTSTAYKTVGGPGMAFFAKLSATGASLVGSSFLGIGSPIAIAADLDGNAVIVGNVSSAAFPVTTDAVQPALKGSSDLFITKFNALATSLQYSTFLGGQANDQASGMTIDAAGNIFIGGVTYSASFPGTSEVLGEVGTGFVLKLTPSGLAWMRPLRANGVTQIMSVEVDANGNVLASGTTSSTHFPTTAGAYRRCVAPNAAAGVTTIYVRLAPDGALKYSTYLYEVTGGPRWAATLPAGDVITMSRLQTAFEQAPNILRRYVFEAAPAVRLDCAINAASYRAGTVTPGMIVTLFGLGIGPGEGVIAPLENGKLPTSVGGVRVLFDGVPASLLYVREDQINAVVPFSLVNAATAQVRVEYQDRSVNPLNLSVRAADPGIFRIGSTEFGAILNQDNTLNTPANPAARGSVITFWTTGMGLFDDTYADGSIIGANVSPLRLPVRVSLFGVDGEVVYAGASPDMVAGVAQLNVRVPGNARVSSRVPIGLTIGDTTVADLAYVSVK
jgi:uncharacterized protein (TIGR03437 family)